MTPLDAAFLQAEDEEPGVSLAISSIAVFEGPTVRPARPSRPSTLSGPLSAQRRFPVARATAADVATVRHAFGGTFNNVVLAAVTGGFRALLRSRDETPAGDSVRSRPRKSRPHACSGL